MRLAHAAFGAMAAMGWLLLPAATGATISGPPAPPGAGEWGPGGGAGGRFVGPVGTGLPVVPGTGGERPEGPVDVAAPGDDESPGADLILPVAVAGSAVAIAAYSLVRRRRRAQLRTTPTGAFEPPVPPLPDLHRRARHLLVETDDSVRTSAEELRFAAARASRGAAELSAEETEEPTRREETVPPAKRPGGRDDAESSAENPVGQDDSEPHTQGPAVVDAARPHPERPSTTDPAEPSPARPTTLDRAKPYAETPAAQGAVTPFAEALADAQGALAAAFRAGQRLDEEAAALSPHEERALLEEILTRCTTAQRRLDTATPAFDQLRALERDITPALECAETRFRELTGRTATAAGTLATLRDGYAPAASLLVSGHVEQAKDRLVFATTELNRARQAADPGDLATAAVHLRAAEGAIDQADVFVTGVERLAVELMRAAGAAKQGAPFTGTYDDPLDVLRRQSRWLLPARSTVAATTDFVTTHRGAVGVTARTRLAEAERHLAQAEADSPTTGTEAGGGAGAEAVPGTLPGAGTGEATGTKAPHTDGTEGTDTPHARRAHALAEEARRLAEQDVRAYGNPYGGPVVDGLAGALLGGIVLGEAPGGGRGDLRGPACFGGTSTRGRRTVGGQF